MDLTTLSSTLQCLLAEHGFTDQPVGGCPTDGGVSAEEVSRITQKVLAELRRRDLA